jgi:hypothetical protein
VKGCRTAASQTITSTIASLPLGPRPGCQDSSGGSPSGRWASSSGPSVSPKRDPGAGLVRPPVLPGPWSSNHLPARPRPPPPPPGLADRGPRAPDGVATHASRGDTVLRACRSAAPKRGLGACPGSRANRASLAGRFQGLTRGPKPSCPALARPVRQADPSSPAWFRPDPGAEALVSCLARSGPEVPRPLPGSSLTREPKPSCPAWPDRGRRSVPRPLPGSSLTRGPKPSRPAWPDRVQGAEALVSCLVRTRAGGRSPRLLSGSVPSLSRVARLPPACSSPAPKHRFVSLVGSCLAGLG